MQDIDIPRYPESNSTCINNLCTYYRPLFDPSGAGGKSRVCDPSSTLARAHPGECTLIRRSSEESFRLCDAFVTERLVSIILADAPKLGPPLSPPLWLNFAGIDLLLPRHDGNGDADGDHTVEPLLRSSRETIATKICSNID